MVRVVGEGRGVFRPAFTEDGMVKPDGSFVIVDPPPNVTGNLHLGHAAMLYGMS
jgi:valyl-tRNA synthetase